MRFSFISSLTLLAIAASAGATSLRAASVPWQQDWSGNPPKVYFTTGDGVFWVLDREIEKGNGTVSLWLHGDHRKNVKVKYRTSLWHIVLDCAGGYRIDASTTFDKDGGVLETWDGLGGRTLIRPGTMYQALEKQLCI